MSEFIQSNLIPNYITIDLKYDDYPIIPPYKTYPPLNPSPFLIIQDPFFKKYIP